MNTRTDAVPHHSPALWGLLAVAAVAAVEVVGVIGWNAWDRRADIRAWLKL